MIQPNAPRHSVPQTVSAGKSLRVSNVSRSMKYGIVSPDVHGCPAAAVKFIALSPGSGAPAAEARTTVWFTARTARQRQSPCQRRWNCWRLEPRRQFLGGGRARFVAQTRIERINADRQAALAPQVATKSSKPSLTNLPVRLQFARQWDNCANRRSGKPPGQPASATRIRVFQARSASRPAPEHRDARRGSCSPGYPLAPPNARVPPAGWARSFAPAHWRSQRLVGPAGSVFHPGAAS